ncbi:hypothetical protein [Actinomycetospora termitidis]|uniref:Uncharacterized protein n=1 Tax=Actinomycetospora termitidis TaxID=3053470 RepID=A0ABT7MFQ5_9PSEU|nr:hypothetical protein [Actinomycetospora sp. Odt1-22]MDL5158984.1 hypothetical protein [Actinomycetospora sp. Odt1-22]
MHVMIDAFHLVKGGNEPDEYEDAFSTMKRAGADVARSGGRARFAVADGATDGYDPGGWARQLARSFAPSTEYEPWWLCAPTETAVHQWYEEMQTRWAEVDRVFPHSWARRKFEESASYATFLAGEIDLLDSDRPQWTALGIGDTVLFQVRDHERLRHVPPLAPGDFGTSPQALSSRSVHLERMVECTTFWSGDLRLGDRLYVATDAVAAWLLRADADPGRRREVWELLAALSEPEEFAELVEGERGSGAMDNDDSTLLRMRIVARPPDTVAVCLPTLGQVASP